MATSMRRVVVIAAATAAVVMASAIGIQAQDGDARDLVKRSLEALPRVPFTAKLKVAIEGKEPREVELSHKFIEGSRASYLQVVAPDELQGIRFLFLERVDGPPEQYMKVAAARTSVRVAGQVRRQPFLGSPFFIADLVEPPIDAFTYKLVGEEELLGRKVILVESVPKNLEEEVYGKTIFAVDPKDALILRRQFFDKKGAVLKVWTVDEVKTIDGFKTLVKQRMVNLQDNSRATLDITEVKYNADLPDKVFTPMYLLR